MFGESKSRCLNAFNNFIGQQLTFYNIKNIYTLQTNHIKHILYILPFLTLSMTIIVLKWLWFHFIHKLLSNKVVVLCHFLWFCYFFVHFRCKFLFLFKTTNLNIHEKTEREEGRAIIAIIESNRH